MKQIEFKSLSYTENGMRDRTNILTSEHISKQLLWDIRYDINHLVMVEIMNVLEPNKIIIRNEINKKKYQ